MPRPLMLNVSSVEVIDSRTSALVPNGSVVVRDGVARVRIRNEVVLQRSGVTAVEKTERKKWLVTFDDASTLTVTKIGCGCG